ncbi:nuclear valosin-containing protein-like [Bacillus rossius redtenbacheri]|uniref:nuclear valosin-containing protein-like n=1 Tax=Bacillus rossius redtenbacheri TaxID=93214 RepID=UPI002FDE5745
MEKKFQSTEVGYFGDPKVILRVEQYLKNHKEMGEIDTEEIADSLQKKYPEYMRRKKKAFQGLVARAVSVLVKENEKDLDDDDDDYYNEEGDGDYNSSVESDYDSINEHESNRANEQQTSLYFQNSRESRGEKELINISSDDDGEEDERDDNINEDIRRGILKKLVSETTIEPVKSRTVKSQDVKSVKSKTNSNTTLKHSNPVLKTALLKNPTSLKYGEIVKTKDADACSNKRKRNNDHLPDASYQKIPKKKFPQLENDSKRDSDRGEFEARKVDVTFKDFAGNKEILKELSKVILHVAQPKIYSTLGISPPRGLLLTGPPGCGKTLLAEAVAGELNVLLLKVSASELVSGVSGQSEERIRDLFKEAVSLAPCVLLLEEVDAITPNRHTAQREMERRIVCQLLSCLDDLGRREQGHHVLIIGTTNRPDSIDPALRRAGRFDTELALGIPDVEARTEILRTVCKSLKLEPQFDYERMARLTPGYVGADLTSLARVAAINAFFRHFENTRQTLSAGIDKNQKTLKNNSSNMEISDDDSAANTGNGDCAVVDGEARKEKSAGNAAEENLCGWLCKQPPLSDKQLEGLCITTQDFSVALKKVCPSAKREGFATVPDVTWEDVGALHDIRQALQIAILAPVKYSKLFASVGISAPAGVLLCGPPGCGKTLLAKAVANEAGINFISVKGPELLNMYLGESERAVRQCFQRARNSAPCVIFFDELDALCPKRSESGEGGASMRVVNQMLTEMDGVEGRGGVFLMAATNRPDIVDPAVLRPGRLDKILYVGLPSVADKVDVLRTLTKNGTKPELSQDVSLEEISSWESCEGYSGADLAALVKEAAVVAIQEVLGAPAEKVVVCRNHFLQAVKSIRPSVTKKDRLYYEKLQKLYSPPPVKDQQLWSAAVEASVELTSSSSVAAHEREQSDTTQQNSAVSSLFTEQHDTLQNTPPHATARLEESSQDSSTPKTAENKDSADKQSSDVDSTLDVDKSPEPNLSDSR